MNKPGLPLGTGKCWHGYRLVLVLGVFWSSVPALSQTATIQYGDNRSNAIQCTKVHTYSFQARAGDQIVAHITETADFGGRQVCGRAGVACSFDQCIEIRPFGSDVVIGMVCTPVQRNSCGHRLRRQLGPLNLPRTEPTS